MTGGDERLNLENSNAFRADIVVMAPEQGSAPEGPVWTCTAAALELIQDGDIHGDHHRGRGRP
ncbi:hypothetical protein, partial [Teichococcus coralli]|uniref:hypothetical protein n=1 Tax=Teichococcus coralli TaxID=2545983 RepID=UPI001F3E9098